MFNRALASIATATLVALIGCSDAVGPKPAEEELEQGIGLAVNLAGAPEVTTVRLVVTAADLAQPIVVYLGIQDGIARGTAQIPIGPRRTFLLQAMDGAGVVRYAGSAVADVVAGTNPPLDIVMRAVEAPGEIPIVGTIGSYTVVLDVTQRTLVPGQFLFLNATVRDPSGAVVSNAEIGWLSTNVMAASVDGNGRVAAHGAGTTEIWACFSACIENTRAVARITVAP